MTKYQNSNMKYLYIYYTNKYLEKSRNTWEPLNGRNTKLIRNPRRLGTFIKTFQE